MANQTVKVRVKSNGAVRTITKRAFDLMTDKYELLDASSVSEVKKSPLDNEKVVAVPGKRGRGRPPKNEA